MYSIYFLRVGNDPYCAIKREEGEERIAILPRGKVIIMRAISPVCNKAISGWVVKAHRRRCVQYV